MNTHIHKHKAEYDICFYKNLVKEALIALESLDSRAKNENNAVHRMHAIEADAHVSY